MIKYKTLFSLVCQHGYYQGNFSDLVFIPTEACSSLLKNYGLYFRPNNFGFEVVAQTKENVSHLLQMINDPLKFSFYVKNKNPLFVNISDLPIPSRTNNSEENSQVDFDKFDRDLIYHFNNKQEAINGENIKLHKNEFISGEDQVLLKSSLFTLPLEAPMDSPKIKAEDETGKESFVYAEEGESQSSINLNLRNDSFGRFGISLNDKHLFDVYTADISPVECFGMLDIHFGDLAANSAALVQEKEFTSPVYHLNFKSRSTVWKYLIIIENKDRFSTPEIQENRKKAKFSITNENIQLPNGSTAIEIRSDEPILLTRTPSRRLSINLPKKESSDSVDIDLPTPDAQQVKVEKKSTDSSEYTFTSEMYVYL